MSLESLRKHLVNNRPPNVASATLLGKGYGITTTQVTRLLTKMGYERSTDNTGWYLATQALPSTVPLYLSITEERASKLLEKFLAIVPSDETPTPHAVALLRKRANADSLSIIKLAEILVVLAKLAEQDAFEI